MLEADRRGAGDRWGGRGCGVLGRPPPPQQAATEQTVTAQPQVAEAASTAPAGSGGDGRVALAPRWPRDDWRPLAQVAAAHEQLQPLIDRELRWCAEAIRRSETQGGNWSAPDPDGPWRQLPGPTLVDRDEQQWVGEVALATAQQRGLPLTDTPSITIVSAEWRRANGCGYWHRSDSYPLPGINSWWVWRKALGLLPSSWTQKMYDHLPVVWEGRGWYTPGAGTSGAIGLIASSSERGTARTLSTQIVRYLQQQLLDGSAQRRLPWRVDTDRWLSLHWLRDADTVHSTLSRRHAALDGATGYAAAARSDPPGQSPSFSAEAHAALETLADEIKPWWLSSQRDGAAFIEQLLQDAGSDAVDERLRNPPDTTEQLLHIDKYEADEQPLDMSPLQPVIDAALPREQWVPLRDRALGEEGYRDTQGEMPLRTLIAASTGRREEAAAAAAGWGGDRLHLFQGADGGEGDIAGLWAVVFDDAGEHAEGAAGLREWLIAFSDGEAWGAYGDRVVGWDAPHGAIRVLNGGTVVWLLAAPDGEAVDAIAERLLTANAPVLWGM